MTKHIFEYLITPKIGSLLLMFCLHCGQWYDCAKSPVLYYSPIGL